MWLVVIILDSTDLYFVKKPDEHGELGLKTVDMTIATWHIYREVQILEGPELGLRLKSRCPVSNMSILSLYDSLDTEPIKIKAIE